MSQDVFRKVGRGGAGNFYSKKDVEDTAIAKPKDLEAQTPALPVADATTTNAQAYSKAGRGGAGNFYEPATPSEVQHEKEEAEKTNKAAIASGLTKPKTGLSGRGGVGNWTDKEAESAAKAEEKNRKKREEMDAKILQDVEAGLAKPPRAHVHDREAGK